MLTTPNKLEQYQNLRAFLEVAHLLSGDAGVVAHGLLMGLPPVEEITLKGLARLARVTWQCVSGRVDKNTRTHQELQAQTLEWRRERELARRDPANLLGVA